MRASSTPAKATTTRVSHTPRGLTPRRALGPPQRRETPGCFRICLLADRSRLASAMFLLGQNPTSNLISQRCSHHSQKPMDPLIQTTSLRYNSCILQSALLKCTIQWLLGYSQTCAATTAKNFRTFSPSQKKCPQLASPLSPPRVPQLQLLTTTGLLSVSVDLLPWTLHTNEIMHHVVLCVWFLSLSRMFSRLIVLLHESLLPSFYG